MKASLFLFQLFTFLSVHAQWIQTNGPYGGSIYCFSILDTQVYAGTTVGLYKSTVNGTSWNRSGLEGSWVTGFQTLPAVSAGMDFVAGAYGEGVYKSIDSGSSWTPANTGLYDLDVYCLTTAVNNSGSHILIAGTVGSGIFRSVNNGTNWNNSGLVSSSVYDLTVADSVVFAATDDGVYRSIDYGLSWNPAPTLPGIFVTCIASAPDGLGGKVIYAGTYGNSMYRSTNWGISWTPMNSGLGSTYVSDIVVNDNDVYAMTFHGIRHTSGTSTSWTSIHNRAPWTLGIHDNGSGSVTFFAGYVDGYGVSRSTNAGTSWQWFTTGMTGRNASALATFSTVTNAGPLFAGTTLEGGSIFRSDDLGNTWTETGMYGIDTWNIGVFPHDSGGMVMLACGYNTGTWRSIDSGDTWHLSLGGPIGTFATLPMHGGGLKIFAGSSNGVQVSTDFGLSWNPANTGLTTHFALCLAASDSVLFAGTYAGGVFKSVNSGANWTPANTGITNMDIRCLAVFGSTIFAGTYGGGVFYSSNNGTSWTPVNTGLTATRINSLVFYGTNLFAGTNNGVFHSDDFGNTWINISTGIFVDNINQLLISDSYLFAGTSVGVWRRPLYQLVTGLDTPSEFGKVAGLLSHFPNPLSTHASIEFIVHQPGLVSLEVFNSSGAIVSVLAHEVLKPGVYQRTWFPDGLPDGLYFCRLQNGQYQENMKLLLIR